MNRLFTTALSVLSLVAIASPSFAQDNHTSKTNTTKIEQINNQLITLKINPVTTKQTTPFNLVGIGYQGFLSPQGIPSGSAFLHKVNRGDINAKTLVQSGIDNGRLSSQTLNDLSYLNAVQIHLNSLKHN